MNKKSIDLLNKAVADELAAVHQYMYFHFHCEDQGYGQLSNLFERTAIEEMKHVERIAERILFLKGEVEMIPSAGVEKIHDVRAMLEMGMKMEQGSIKDYNNWANESSANADSGTKKVFEALVDDEERHLGQYELHSDKIAKFGEQYLALHALESGAPAEEE